MKAKSIDGGTAGSISFAANYETFKALREIAKQEGKTVSFIVRNVVVQWIEKRNKRK